MQAVRDEFSRIDWTDDVETLFRPVNLGLRKAVAGAVTWAVEKHGEVIVLEEDTIPGDLFVPYAIDMLERFRDDERIAHISGYNVVPEAELSFPSAGSRLTHYPESIAWATWARAWAHFDDTMAWGGSVNLTDLAKVTGSRVSAVRWKQSFDDVAANRISTWAYRWIASMWSRGSLTVSPNRNLVTYGGYDEGTNSALWMRRGPSCRSSRVTSPSLETDSIEFDPGAERWINRVVFGARSSGWSRARSSLSC